MDHTNLSAVHQYRQSPWLAKYIKYNADQRAKAKTKFEKWIFDLQFIDYCFFEKLIENVRKRINLALIDKTDTQK